MSDPIDPDNADNDNEDHVIDKSTLFGTQHSDDDNIIHSEPLFDAKYMGRESGAKEDFQTSHLQWLNASLSQIRSDAFQKDRLSDEDAKNYLQGDKFRKEFSLILAALAAHQKLNGEIRQKSEEIISIAKTLFNDNDIWKNWKDDINRRKQKFRKLHYGDGNYTPFNCPRDKWPVTDKNGLPLPQYPNAIAALRWYLEDEGITLRYDHWRNGITIDNPQKSKFPRESKDAIVKNWINQICDKFNILFTIEHMKYAIGQLAVFHQFHSLLDYFAALKWNGIDRLPKLVKDIMKLEGTGFSSRS
jgi:hypothetical protein